MLLLSCLPSLDGTTIKLGLFSIFESQLFRPLMLQYQFLVLLEAHKVKV
jgi:hypothetical protein